ISASLCRRGPVYRFAIDFDPRNIRKAAETVSTARRQICKSDLINLTEIDFVEQGTFGIHLIRSHVELEPAHFCKEELTLVIVVDVGIHVISDEPRSIGK